MSLRCRPTALTTLTALTAVSVLTAPPASAQEPDTARADTTTNPRQEGLPLAPARKLAYTAREGSWISLDVSPDGRTLVFDLLGDLYTMSFGGGRATPLTQGMAFDMQPRFSPDGRRVVFVSDRGGGWNVWIVSLDRSDSVQVTRGKDNEYQSPEWTPDGQYVVATKEAGSPGKLWMYHVEGGAGLALVDEPENLRVMGAAFGPDPRYIWVARRTGTWTYNSPMGEWDLAVYDRETGELATRSNRWGGAVRPTVSPDGRWLVYGSRHVDETGLRIRNLATGAERWLAHPVQRDEQESAASRDALPGMSFTPDSRQLVAAWGGKIWRVPVDSGAPVEIPFEAPIDVDLGPRVDFAYPIPDSATFVARQIRDAVPSPDGTRLAFTVLDQLYVMAYPGGSPRALTDTTVTAHQPTWSPDGRWIAYVTARSAEGGHLWRVGADGGRPNQLTRAAAFYQQPAWSPAGDRIVVIRGPARAFTEALQRGVPGGAEDLVWVPAEGGAATVIGPVDFTAPHFTRDSSRIHAFSSDEELISFRWDGTDRKGHVKVTGRRPPGADNPQDADLILMAPAGDRAIAQINNDLFVVTVPVVGGETPSLSVSNPDNAAVPVRALTDIGGQFPAWSGDGARVHFSVGNAHFVYDLAAARAFDDSVKAAKADTAKTKRKYQPRETRIEIRVARDIPQGAVVLRGARVVTMRGDEVIENADLVIRNNRITEIGPQGTVQVPTTARVVPVAGMTIVPGFVDTHAHLRAAADIHRRDVWSYMANLAYGVTTTRDPQTATTDVLTYEDLARAGRILAPRMYSTGPGVFSSEAIGSLEEARDVLSRYAEYYDTKTIKMYVAGNREQRQWIIQAARDARIMPTTEGALDYAMDMTMALDGYPGQEHNTPGFPFFEDVTRLYVEAGTAYTPTILVTYGGPWAENYWYAGHSPFESEKLRRFTPFEEIRQRVLRRNAGWFHPTQHTMARVARLVTDIVRGGGTAGVGSHGQLQGLGYHWELWNMQMGGLTPHEALEVATIHGARAVGLDEELGSIEPGKLADLVVLASNPLEDIRNTNTVRYVMKNGRLYDGDTLNEIHPRERQAGPFYWQGTDLPGARE